MKALIADKFPEAGRKALADSGIEVSFKPDVTPEELADIIGDHEVLIVRGKKVPGAAIQAATNLQLIVRAGAGYNTIDVAAASGLGCYVANCPGKNAIAVAELTIGLLIGIDRRIAQASAELTEGKWNKKEYSKADGLFGKTYGVIGLGQIGQETAFRAAALGMKVVGWSRSLTDERAQELGIERAETPVALAGRCDAVSVHLPANKDTTGIVGADFFAAFKERSILINVSRGGVVDEQALQTAMESKGLRYATDVFDNEPGGHTAEFDNSIAKHPETVCTPHIGAATSQAQAAVAEEAVRVVTTFQRTGDAPNCVNLKLHNPSEWQLNVRHANKVGVLAAVLVKIREAGINVEELENIIFDGAEAACARIRLGSQPSGELVGAVNDVDNVIDAQCVAL